jgi:transcriptional regulator with XRE-family HTH domain
MNGNDVIEYRKRRNLSRKALAAATGLTEGKIWRIENKSIIYPDEQHLLDLVGVIPVTVDGVVEINPAQIQIPIAHTAVTGVIPAETESTPVVVDTAEPVDFGELLKSVATSYEHYFSNSELKTFKRCRRKWWLGWFRGLRPKHESPVGVRQIGDRLHRALKEHYVPGGPKTTNQLLDALEREITLDRTTLGDTISYDVREKFEKEADLERIMLEGYLEWLADTGADSELEIVSAEQYLEADLSEFNGTVALIGKIDVRVRRTIDGVHLFFDHKSVGDLRTPTLTLPLDEQMLHYHLLEAMIVGDGERCDGALYNMLRRVKRTPRAQPPFYARVEVRHNEHELSNYRRRVVSEIQDILELRNNIEAWPEAAVHSAYPNPTRDCTWDCPFFSVCPMFDDGSRVEDMLSEYFTETNPLEYYLREILGETEGTTNE